MNPAENYVEAALYLISPYREPKNEMKDPSSSLLNSPSDLLTETVSVPQLKLHYLEIPGQFTGGTVTFQKNPCLELRYFFSKSNNVVISKRDGIGGFYEIRFQDEKHDYLKNKAKMDQTSFGVGATIDITKELTDFKGRFDETSTNYMYFFCPFVQVGAEETDFEVLMNLNKNPVEVRPKEEIDREVDAINKGEEVVKAPNLESLEEKIRNILSEIKGDGATANVKKRMEEAPQNYFEISSREINVSVHGEQSTDVKIVDSCTL